MGAFSQPPLSCPLPKGPLLSSVPSGNAGAGGTSTPPSDMAAGRLGRCSLASPGDTPHQETPGSATRGIRSLRNAGHLISRLSARSPEATSTHVPWAAKPRAPRRGFITVFYEGRLALSQVVCVPSQAPCWGSLEAKIFKEERGRGKITLGAMFKELWRSLCFFIPATHVLLSSRGAKHHKLGKWQTPSLSESTSSGNVVQSRFLPGAVESCVFSFTKPYFRFHVFIFLLFWGQKFSSSLRVESTEIRKRA